MRRYIFTERERSLLREWIESGEEGQETRNVLSWIRHGWPDLAEDMTLLFTVIDRMMRLHRWRGYTTRGSEFGSALRRAESALMRARRGVAT